MAPPTHYSGQRDVGTGMMHHPSTAKALFAGSRRRSTTPDKCGDSADWIASVNASGTCPPADAALLTALCTGVIKP